MSAPQPNLAPPLRACGGCTMCCKVMAIRELEKPAGTWCTHCRPGSGCAIYETRPGECRSFNCLWVLHPALGPEWRPDKSKMVLMREPGAGRLIIKCDPGVPHAWRKEPYRSQIARWAAEAGPRGGEVVVLVGYDMTLIARDRELHVGVIREDDSFDIQYDASGRLLRCNVSRGELQVPPTVAPAGARPPA